MTEDEQAEEDINSPEDIPDEKKNRNRKKDKKNKKSKKKKKSRRRSKTEDSDFDLEPNQTTGSQLEGSPVSSDPDFEGPPQQSLSVHRSLSSGPPPPAEETSPISSDGSSGGERHNGGRDYSPSRSLEDFDLEEHQNHPDTMFEHRRREPQQLDRPRRPPQTPPEPSPEGDTTPLGEHSPSTPTYMPSGGGGRHAIGRGPRTPEGPSPPPMDRNSRLCEDSPPLPPQASFVRGRGAPRTPEGSPQGLLYEPEDAVASPPRHLHGRNRDRHCKHEILFIRNMFKFRNHFHNCSVF